MTAFPPPTVVDTTAEQVELYSPEFFADPYRWYSRLRETDPVHWHDDQAMWILTRFSDVAMVARKPKIFSSRLAALDTRTPSPPVRESDLPLVREVDAVHRQEFIQMDPPEHTGKRLQVSPRFSPTALEPLRGMIAEIVGGLLDAVADRGGMDVLTDVAKKLPLLVISRLMGIPDDDVEMIAEQAQRRMAGVLSLADDRLQVATTGFRETASYLSEVLDARRSGCPIVHADDVLGDLALAEGRGAITREESLANAMMIIDAGHETTIQLICNGTLALLRHPDAWERLVSDPRGVAPLAVDETLRWDPPLHALRRIVAEDIDIDGRTLRGGDRVLAVVAAANRDPRRFAEPDRFDVMRRPNPHLSLGAGAHFCLGQYLAKIEAQEYFVALAERFPTAVPPPPGAVTYAAVPRVRSVTALPITWTSRTPDHTDHEPSTMSTTEEN